MGVSCLKIDVSAIKNSTNKLYWHVSVGGCSGSQFIFVISRQSQSIHLQGGLTGTPLCFCACMIYSHGSTLWGELSLCKYPHLQAVLCFHQLTACLSGISSCWKHQNKEKKKNLNSELSICMSSQLLPSQMWCIQTVLLLKDFVATSVIRGAAETQG